MKVVLLIMFVIAGQLEGPYVVQDPRTREPIVFASEKACRDVVDAKGLDWIAAEIEEHQTQDVTLLTKCEVKEGAPA